MLILILSGVIVMITHFLEGIAGFGGAVMALPFLNLTVGLKDAVYTLGIFGTLMAFYIVLRSYREINWREFGFIALWAIIGMIPGIILFDILPAEHLCIMLGIFMFATGIHGTWQTDSSRLSPPPSSARSWLMKLLLVTGGVFQGAFGSGGPCIVIYTAKAIKDKTRFRVTLSLLWLIMNLCRLTTWFIRGELYNWQLWKMILIIFPFMIAGLLFGDYMHYKLNARLFKKGVYILLGISGIVMVINNFIRLFCR